MARKVPPRQLRQRLVLRERASLRRALLEKRVRELLPQPRAAADHAFELRIHDQIGQPHSSAGNARPVEHGGQRRTRQMPPACKRAFHDLAAACEDLVVEPSLAAVMPVAGEDARRRQREHPADVLRRYEMPGRPKDVRPKDVAPIEGAIDVGVGERRCAKRQCPLGAGVVLRLDGAEP